MAKEKNKFTKTLKLQWKLKNIFKISFKILLNTISHSVRSERCREVQLTFLKRNKFLPQPLHKKKLYVLMYQVKKKNCYV